MKDPAFLFYSKDFISGVQDLTMEERGQYITLLCLQHQKGRLTEKMIRLCRGICGGEISADVLVKFRQDENGDYYNERLEIEMDKRRKHCDKQSDRAKEGWKKRKEKDAAASAVALPLVNANVDVDIGSKVLKKQLEETKDQKPENPIPEKKHSSVFTDFDTRSPELKEVEYPFNTESFRAAWNEWKEFKRREFSFKYKSPQSENAALASLKQLSGNEQIAIAIMAQSKANGWKGFFELKQKTNGTTKHVVGKTIEFDQL